MFEVLNAVVSIFYKSKEVYMESNIYGKTKMVIQSIGFIAILITFPAEPHWIFIDLLWLSIIFTILNVFVRIAELKEKGHIKNKILFTQHKKKHENI
jgi:phosphatidylglycerophosphate synthase